MESVEDLKRRKASFIEIDTRIKIDIREAIDKLNTALAYAAEQNIDVQLTIDNHDQPGSYAPRKNVSFMLWKKL